MPRFSENMRARRHALQLLYQRALLKVAEGADETNVETIVVSECPAEADEMALVGERLEPYAAVLADGVTEQVRQIDAWIESVAENWTLSRMPIVDLNIIRIATYEIAFCEDIPTGVAINEAVEIAKSFGNDDTSKFVNGVLGRIAKLVETGAAAGIEPLEDAPEQPGEGAQGDAGELAGVGDCPPAETAAPDSQAADETAGAGEAEPAPFEAAAHSDAEELFDFLDDIGEL